MASRRWERSLWIPFGIGLGGSLVAVLLWWIVIDDRRALLHDALVAASTETATALEDGLARRVHELEFIANDWGRSGERASSRVQVRAEELIGLRSGLEWLSWSEPAVTAGVPTGTTFRWLEPGPDGRRLGELALPVRSGEALVGVLFARIDPVALAEGLLEARAQPYAVRLQAAQGAGDVFYERGEAAPVGWQTRGWGHETTVETPFGEPWRLMLLPTLDYARARLSPLPHYLLAAGIALSVVLGLLVGSLRRTAESADRQHAANARLSERESELTELAAMLESRVAQRTEELEDAITELEAFNFSVSHDLRSPLGAILNFASIIEEDHGDALGSDGTALLGRIKRSATRAIDLLEDLLQLSRAGRTALEWERLDLSSLARQAFSRAREADGGGEAELVLDPLPEVECDRALIETVFENLFTNALKYARDGEKRRIEVTTSLEGDTAVVTVADNGIGFDMRFAPKLFKVFERLHADDGVEGNGVGLAIVARIVRRHGGRVWAEGVPGEGARFSFSLPTEQKHGGLG